MCVCGRGEAPLLKHRKPLQISRSSTDPPRHASSLQPSRTQELTVLPGSTDEAEPYEIVRSKRAKYQQLDTFQPSNNMAYLLSSNLLLSWGWQFTRCCQALHTSHRSRVIARATPGPTLLTPLPGLTPPGASRQRSRFLPSFLDVHTAPHIERWAVIPSTETGAGLRTFLAK